LEAIVNRLRLSALGVLAAIGALVVALLVPASAAGAASAPYCGLVWGSLPEHRATSTAGLELTDVRAGRHACFDRLVIQLRGPASPASYDVRYVAAVHQVGSGARVPLDGGAALQVVVRAPAYDSSGRATFVPLNRNRVVNVDGYRTLEQVSWAGSFEGRTTLGIGTRARLPFRPFTLLGTGGSDGAVRLVIDVAHAW
jgi:hypothetical protein